MGPPEPPTRLLTDRDLFERVIGREVPAAERFVWLGTATLKDLHVPKGRRYVPFLEILSDLVDRGVAIRLLHAAEPGPRFREDFDRYPNLLDGLERLLCPRVHFKSIVVDGRFAYTGSANLTGAGLGAKSATRRNFEAGLVTTDPALVDQVMAQFDAVWIGSHCRACGRRDYCPTALDLVS